MPQAVAVAPQQSTNQLLGNWRLARKVAESRWFIVYLAAPATCDPDWPADYALKCVQPALMHDARPRKLLHREKQVSSEVIHPHLATVLDADLDHDPPFVVQPFYEGCTVRQLLQLGVPGISKSLWIARQVAEAIVAMQRADWMHGDIKPENVIVSSTGHATLIDLGFARRCAAHHRRGEAAWQTTLAYAAPEMFLPQGEQTTASDIYSLGVMLYEMLAGQTPFGSTDPGELARCHLQAEVSDIRRCNPLVPPDVVRLVMQLLEKEPDQRPPWEALLRQLVDCEIACFALR